MKISNISKFVAGFFISLYHYHTKPQNDDEKLVNIKLAFEYLEETGFDWKSKRDARPTDVLRGDAGIT